MPETSTHLLDLIKNEYFVQWIISPTAESSHYWSKWIAAHPERKQDVELARQLINSVEYRIDESMPEADYDLVLEQIVSHSQRKKLRAYAKNNWVRRSVGIAASAILVVFLSILATRFITQTTDQSVVRSQTILKSTQPGQKLTFQLPDGSKVTLNSESQLAYEMPFNEHRNLTLTGEAFFEVTRDEYHPFVIHSGKIRTKVLGTSFNVRYYPEEVETSVAVVTGKVEVSDDHGNQANLIPNVRGVFNLNAKQLLIEPFSAEKVIGWKDGFLAFHNTPVREVFARLERWYGVKIIVMDDSLLAGEYTGSYQNASLEKVMNGIGYAIGLEFTIDGKQVTVDKKWIP